MCVCVFVSVWKHKCVCSRCPLMWVLWVSVIELQSSARAVHPLRSEHYSQVLKYIHHSICNFFSDVPEIEGRTSHM